MEEKSNREKMADAKKIYFVDDFRAHMRRQQGFSDEDFSEVSPLIKKRILKSEETNPLELFEHTLDEVALKWNKPTFPLHADWHHYIVPGAVMASLRNCGYPISDGDIEEAMKRGERFMGGSCGFAGTCGGAFSVGIILSLVKNTTPLHDNERSEVMRGVVDTLGKIAEYPRRCCKRSSYIAIENAIRYLQEMGFEKISSGEIKCRWYSQNEMCLGVKCPYFPKKQG